MRELSLYILRSAFKAEQTHVREILHTIGHTLRFICRLGLFSQLWFRGAEEGLEDTLSFILLLACNPPWHPSIRLEMHVQLLSRSQVAMLRGAVWIPLPSILERRHSFRRCGRPRHAQQKGEGTNAPDVDPVGSPVDPRWIRAEMYGSVTQKQHFWKVIPPDPA